MIVFLTTIINQLITKQNYFKMENSLRVERAKKKITQEELGKKVGLSRQAIHNIETGRFIPSVKNALKIAKFFGKSFEEIFKLEKTD